jgi:Polyketide cyclase / dehydrase and lipid transport
MANDFEVFVDAAVSADAAWALAGDPAGMPTWFRPVTSVVIEKDVRRAVMGNGAEILERLVDRNDAARRYSYVVISGIPDLTSHRATIRVEPTPGGSRVFWRQTATSSNPDYDIEARLRPAMTKGLEHLREILEAGVSN